MTISGSLGSKGAAELSRLSKLIGNAKFEGNINASGAYYRGISQFQLAAALEDSDTCRLKALDIFNNVVETAKSASEIPRKHAPKLGLRKIAPRAALAERYSPLEKVSGQNGDTYQNNGTNNGIIGPVTFGRPEFQLTTDIVAKIISSMPRDKPVQVISVGSQAAYQQGATLVQALQNAGFSVTYTTVGMLIPIPEQPVTVTPETDNTVVVFSPKS